MKTLDEVIEAERHCIGIGCQGCPYDIVKYGGSCECNEDALYYLKTYRRLEMAYVKALADIEENPALSWNELKQMKGKPVWVEGSLLLSHWLIIDEVKDDYIICADRYRLSIPLYKDVMGKIWQAYRKERYEPDQKAN